MWFVIGNQTCSLLLLVQMIRQSLQPGTLFVDLQADCTALLSPLQVDGMSAPAALKPLAAFGLAWQSIQ